jgi:uncharacterized membrane protein
MNYKDFLAILKTRAEKIFVLDRVLCRVLAAWCAIAADSVMDDQAKFWELSFGQDMSLVTIFVWMAIFFAMYTVAALLLPKYHTDSWFLLLFATICSLCWLGGYNVEKYKVFFMLAVIVVYGLFVIYFIQRNEALFADIRLSYRHTAIFAAFCGVFCAFIIAAITCLRYKTFSSPNFDFGLFCNMFHNMKETGLPMATSERNGLLSHFAVHISPIYYILLPFYWLFPTPETLQIGQAVVLASGVIPVVLIAKRLSLSPKVAAIAAAIYSLYPAISCGCFYDIHENCFLAPLLLWMFYFFEAEKYIPMYITALGVLSVKEDAAVYVFFFALYVIFARQKVRHGSLLALGSLCYFGIALYILTNYGDGAMINRFNNLIFKPEDGLLGAVKTALFNPGFLLTQLFSTSSATWEKVVYILQMFLPLCFLPFCSKKPSRWLLLAPMLMNLVTMYIYQYNINFQYNFGVSAFLIYAMMVNLPELSRPVRRNMVALGAAACLLMYTVYVMPYYNTYTERWESGKETYEQMEAILDSLPEDASLNVSTFLLAHVADRDVVYELNYHKDVADVDFVVLDLRYSNAALSQHRAAYLKQGYTVYATYDGLIQILQSPAKG